MMVLQNLVQGGLYLFIEYDFKTPSQMYCSTTDSSGAFSLLEYDFFGVIEIYSHLEGHTTFIFRVVREARQPARKKDAELGFKEQKSLASLRMFTYSERA
jgi:hypothetical protein